MNHCKTCKHWNTYKDEFPRSLREDGHASGGICKSDKLTEEYSFRYYTNDRLVYPYSEGGYFWTGHNFGCVHHEEKK